MSKKHSNSDDRPRIYIDAAEGGCRWRITWNGRERPAKTAGEALDAALAAVNHADAVIFFHKFPGEQT